MAEPTLPPGFERHRVVYLEEIHLPLPAFDIEYDLVCHWTTTPSQVAERIKEATIIVATVCPVTKADLEKAPHVQLIVVSATGMAFIDKSYCAKRGIVVTNCPQSNVEAVGEHFLALYFASRRKISQIHYKVTTSSEWVDKHSLLPTWTQGPPLSCAKEVLGIIGYGALGRRFEGLAKSLGFGKIMISGRKGATKTQADRVPFDELIRTASTIVVCCPRDADTIDLIGRPEFDVMRKEVLIINMGRGGIVNEADLAQVLKSGRIFGAATDVLETEPGGPGTSPLLPDVSKGQAPIPNLIVTSHVAWFAERTIETLQGLQKDAVESFVMGKLEEGDGVKSCVAVYQGKIWK